MYRLKRSLGAAFALALLGSAAAFGQAPSAQAKPLDPANMHTQCKACDDFYHFANGGWTERNEIPPAYPAWGSFNELSEKNNDVLHTVLEHAAKHDAAASANDRKLGAFYASCMDSSRIEHAGAAPLQPVFRRIDAITDLAGLQREIAHMQGEGVGALFGFSSEQDPKHSTEVIARASQGGLGLPDRDYYTRTDERSAKLRGDYAAYMSRMFQLAGDAPARAEARVKAVMAIETALAQASMTRVQRRDPNAVYHKLTIAGADSLTPSWSWTQYLTLVGAPPVHEIDVQQPDFFTAVNGMLKSVSLADWQSYLQWRMLSSMAPTLSSAFVNENFRFNGTTLTGTTELQPRWKRCLQATSGAMGEALGEAYVRTAFTPAAKARALDMVRNLSAALQDRLQALTWMGPETRARALAKLAAFQRKIGYPDKWRDYSALTVSADDYPGNVIRARAFDVHRRLAKIGRPVDRGEWGMTPPTVNASYNPSMNDITFPAGILQPPFFDPNADDAVNYGGMGAVIGHEMTHGFDDEGRQYDAHGNLVDWWTPADKAAFEQRAALVEHQFDAYVPIDSLHVNGKLTLGENIADLGGLTIAYAAFQRAQRGKPAQPPIDGFTPEQRFFLAWAQIWRGNVRPEAMRLQVQTNEHAPGQWRVIGPLSNMPEFAAAFHCQAGDPMVRPDSLRALIW
jgi:putative endopeptidase